MIHTVRMQHERLVPWVRGVLFLCHLAVRLPERGAGANGEPLTLGNLWRHVSYQASRANNLSKRTDGKRVGGEMQHTRWACNTLVWKWAKQIPQRHLLP